MPLPSSAGGLKTHRCRFQVPLAFVLDAAQTSDGINKAVILMWFIIKASIQPFALPALPTHGLQGSQLEPSQLWRAERRGSTLDRPPLKRIGMITCSTRYGNFLMFSDSLSGIISPTGNHQASFTPPSHFPFLKCQRAMKSGYKGQGPGGVCSYIITQRDWCIWPLSSSSVDLQVHAAANTFQLWCRGA